MQSNALHSVQYSVHRASYVPIRNIRVRQGSYPGPSTASYWPGGGTTRGEDDECMRRQPIRGEVYGELTSRVIYFYTAIIIIQLTGETVCRE